MHMLTSSNYVILWWTVLLLRNKFLCWACCCRLLWWPHCSKGSWTQERGQRAKIEANQAEKQGQVQPSQDNRDHMVKKLEKGSNVTSFSPQQHQAKRKNLVQSKELTMEHKLSTCSLNSKNKTRLYRREKYCARTRVGFRCKEKGHLIAACPIQQSEVGSNLIG